LFSNIHSARARRFIICGFTDSATYFHFITQTARFSKNKRKAIEHKMRALFFSTPFA
jgi:hypothetical protein